MLHEDNNHVPCMDAVEFKAFLDKLTRKVLTIKKNHKDKNHRNPILNIGALYQNIDLY